MNVKNLSKFKPLDGGCQGLLAIICLLALGGNAFGQEALRGELAGDATASSLQRAQTTLGYYNLLLGDTAWRFSSALSFIYTDNATYSSSADSSDFIISPSLNTQIHWPISLQNSLDLGVNVGYEDYVLHSDLNQFYISPGSGLSFDVYLDDVKINLHDRVSITQTGYQDPGAAGNGQSLVSLNNTAGVNALMDLDKGDLTAGYDHANYVSLSSSQEQPASSSDNIYASAGYRVEPRLMAGIEAGITSINSGANAAASATNLYTPSAVQYSAGVFGDATISDYLSARLDFGYEIYNNDSSGTNAASNGSGFYFSASVSHRVNKWLGYTLSAGRNTDLAAYGQAQSTYHVAFSPAWSITQKWTLGSSASWTEGSQVTSRDGQGTYTQYTFAASLARPLTKKLTGSLSFTYSDETSGGGSIASYQTTTIGLNFNYQF